MVPGTTEGGALRAAAATPSGTEAREGACSDVCGDTVVAVVAMVVAVVPGVALIAGVTATGEDTTEAATAGAPRPITVAGRATPAPTEGAGAAKGAAAGTVLACGSAGV
jgi:hypothetical protein